MRALQTRSADALNRGNSEHPQEQPGRGPPGHPRSGWRWGPRPGKHNFPQLPASRSRSENTLPPTPPAPQTPPQAPHFFWWWRRLGEGCEGLEGLQETMTRSGGRRTTSHKPGRHKEKGAAPPLGPTESPAGQAGGEDGRGPAGRAAGDSGVAGPRRGAPRLPAHPGPRLHRAVPPASRATPPPHRLGARRTHAETPRSGRRAPPAPPDPRRSGAEMLARLPFGVLRLLFIVPVYPACVLVVQLQALLAGRRLAVLRHSGGASCSGDAGGRG